VAPVSACHDGGLSSSLRQPLARRRRRAAAVCGLLACAIVLATGAASAPALQIAAPLGSFGAPGGCVRDWSATDLGGCPRASSALQDAAALALVDRGRHVAVAAPGSDAVAFLRRTPGSGALAHGFCVSGPGDRSCPAHAAGLHGADALAADSGMLDVGSIDDRAVVVLRGGAQAGCVSAGPVPGCALRDRALGHVAALAVSPDGRLVYAATYGGDPGEDTIVALRQRTGGARSGSPVLRPLGGPGGCAQSLGPGAARCVRVSGLQGAVAVAVSPDGRSVYAASSVSSALAQFTRNGASGAITPAGCVGDTTSVGADDAPCATRTPGLRGADAVLVSPDGRSVYVASADPGAVLAFTRDPASGALRQIAGPGGCLVAFAIAGCTTAPELRGARALSLAPGARELDVAAPGADAVVPLTRDPASGALSAPAWGPIDVPGLAGVGALASFDGELYGASAVDGGVIALRRGT